MNDFVLLKDRTNSTDLRPADVRFLCDRRAGIGADGVIRAVKAEFIPEWDGAPDLWFMDYRNADGSIAEMCGNGLRVFGRFLLEEDLVNSHEMRIATRAGERQLTELSTGRYRAGMGPAAVSNETTWVRLGDREFEAITVNVGNPHAVVQLPDDCELSTLDLHQTPEFDPQVYPEGTNVEFVHQASPRELAMRVYERGSAETLSCGTGVVATAAAQAYRLGDDGHFQVDVRGGRLEVDLHDDLAQLTGPAVLVARGEVNLPD